MHFRLFFFLLVLFLLVPMIAGAGQVNSFIYHRFDDERYPSTNISVAVFTQQLEFLQQQQIPLVSTQEISERIARGERLPDHAVMLTVDDAYRSFYEAGMPVIRKYGVPVSLFVNTDSVGTPGYMSWDEIREVVASGVEIGNHTATHAYLVEKSAVETYAQWQQRVRDDILAAQQAFARELGFKPNIFAYPYGEYSPEIIEILKELGFIAAYAQQSGVIYSRFNPYILPRFPMGGPSATLDDFKSKVKMKPLPVLDQKPVSPIIVAGQTPPVLDLYMPGLFGGTQQFNCFAQGNNSCHVNVNKARGDGWYQVVAEKPLSSRRNKYTLTLQSPEGGWLWFSQLWINATLPARAGGGN